MKTRKIPTTFKCSKEIPTTLELTVPLSIECSSNEDGTPKIPTFKMLANTGEPMKLNGFIDKVIIDIKGFESKQVIPVLKEHGHEVGHTTKITANLQTHEIHAEGILSVPNEDQQQIIASSKLGFPWQASIGGNIKIEDGEIQATFLDKGETAVVNGKKHKGPLIIAHKTIVGELTITKLGADSNTTVTVAATKKGINNMNPFDTWLQATICDPMGMKLEDLTDEQKTKAKVRFEAQQTTTPTSVPPTTKPLTSDPSLDRIKKANELEASNAERIDSITAIAANYQGVELNEDYIKDTLKLKGKTVVAIKGEAIRENWSVDKFELECNRAERKNLGEFAIHSSTQPTFEESEFPAISCAIARNAGMVANEQIITTGCQNLQASNQRYRKVGYEHAYKEETLEASEKYRDYSLCMLLDQANVQANGQRYSGRLGTDGFIQHTRNSMHQLRAAGNTTWSGLDIFDDAANKLLWAGYESVPNTWGEWVSVENVSDFKTSNIYRMHVDGGYKRVAADGLLKHGTLSDDKFTHSADTYGKLVGLNRKDLINDDLGALNRIMGSLGSEGAKFLEELFYQQFLSQRDTLFTAGNNNTQTGAATTLDVDGLTTAEQLFMDQTQDDAPIGVMSSIVLVGTALSVLAAELFQNIALDVGQSTGGTSKKRPNLNPHVGKWRPVTSPYLNNTNVKQRIPDIAGAAISNQLSTQWFLMPSPNSAQGAIIIGSFLNGNVRPIIESADAAFDTLGLLWRAFHDAGADNGDPKLAVHSKGAA